MDASSSDHADKSPQAPDSRRRGAAPEDLLRSVDLSELRAELHKFAVPTVDLSGLTAGLSGIRVPTVDFSGLAAGLSGIRVPTVDFSGLAAALPRIDPRVFDPIIGALEKFQANFVADLRRLTALTRLSPYPVNLSGIDGLDVSSLFSVLEDGIPLYKVPREATAKRLIYAVDLPSRRKILGERFDAIVDDCDNALSYCTSSDYLYEVSAVREAVAAIRDGHRDAGQALAATVMDSLLWRWGDRNDDDWRLVTRKSRSKKLPPRDIDDLLVSTSMVMLPVYVAHATFRPKGGDPIPHVFNRHATLHRISYRQYSKRNCAVSLMMATSVLDYMCEYH